MNIGLNTAAGDALKGLIERIERLREDKAAIAADEKEVFASAKGQGFDPKIMRKVLKIRAEDAAKRREENEILNLYLHALGEDDQPLFVASGRRLEVNDATRRSLAKSLRGILPEGVASVTIDTGGASVRLQRDEAGELQVFEGVGG